MRIAQIAPLFERVPPKKYGGTERVVSTLTEELVRRGHKVTLFASGDSKTKAKLVSTVPKALWEIPILEEAGYTILNIRNAYKSAENFDVIHNHNDYYAFPFASFSKTPTLTTFHNSFSTDHKKIYEEFNFLPLVSISKSQQRSLKNLNWIANIYHGVDVSKFPFGERPKDYLLTVGRIAEEKGTHIAINVAKRLGKKLLIAARLGNQDVDYFRKMVAPQLNHQIRWLGEVNDRERNTLMSEALCMIHPVTWPEPFGLVMIEAMATGCPVVGLRKGSVPEVVKNEKTGFVVDRSTELVKAVQSIDKISRKGCREYAEENFSISKMVDQYEKAYEKVIKAN